MNMFRAGTNEFQNAGAAKCVTTYHYKWGNEAVWCYTEDQSYFPAGKEHACLVKDPSKGKNHHHIIILIFFFVFVRKWNAKIDWTCVASSQKWLCQKWWLPKVIRESAQSTVDGGPTAIESEGENLKVLLITAVPPHQPVFQFLSDCHQYISLLAAACLMYPGCRCVHCSSAVLVLILISPLRADDFIVTAQPLASPPGVTLRGIMAHEATALFQVARTADSQARTQLPTAQTNAGVAEGRRRWSRAQGRGWEMTDGRMEVVSSGIE